MIERLKTDDEFRWISDAIWPLGTRPDGGEGHTVRHILPSTFEAYFKILHPIYFRHSGPAWGAADEADWDEWFQKNCSRVRWAALATKHGLVFNKLMNESSFRRAFPNGWPRRFSCASEGDLGDHLLKKLAGMLGTFTVSGSWFYQYFFCANPRTEEELYRGTPEDVLTINDTIKAHAGPTYWWPQDREWCVCSDYDLTFTIVGARESAIRDIESAEEFEGFRVEVLDRIDDESDIHNREDSEPG